MTDRFKEYRLRLIRELAARRTGRSQTRQPKKISYQVGKGSYKKDRKRGLPLPPDYGVDRNGVIFRYELPSDIRMGPTPEELRKGRY
jgi:hypothetical protein